MQKISFFHLFIDPIQSVLESSHQSIIFVIYDLCKETKKKKKKKIVNLKYQLGREVLFTNSIRK